MKFPEKMLLKLPAGMLGRIDAAAGKGGRSEFVRGAIEAALGGVPAVVSAPKVSGSAASLVKRPESAGGFGPRRTYSEVVRVPTDRVKKSTSGGRWDADNAAFLDGLRNGPVSPRALAERLGWQAGRYDRAERDALQRGAVFSSGGMLWAAEDA